MSSAGGILSLEVRSERLVARWYCGNLVLHCCGQSENGETKNGKEVPLYMIIKSALDSWQPFGWFNELNWLDWLAG
jgi:hypothetical protein